MTFALSRLGLIGLLVLGLCPVAWPESPAQPDGSPMMTDKFMFPGLFARDFTRYGSPGAPTERARKLRSGDDPGMVALEGVDPPVPYDPRRGFGCVGLKLYIGADGYPKNVELLNPVPRDGDFKLLKAALSLWRFSPSEKIGRMIMTPLVVANGEIRDQDPAKFDRDMAAACRRPAVSYQFTLPPGVSLDRRELTESSRFLVDGKEDPLQTVRDHHYPALPMEHGITGCVSLAFGMDRQGLPVDFQTLKAWPADAGLAEMFVREAVASVKAMPMQGAPGTERSRVDVVFRLSGVPVPSPETCAPAPVTPSPAPVPVPASPIPSMSRPT